MSSKSSYSSTQPPRKRRKRVKMIARITSYDYNVQYDMRQKSQASLKEEDPYYEMVVEAP